jgi:iron complex transport system permease protein
MKLLALVALAVVICVAAPFVGPALDTPHADFVFWQLRVPRVLAGAVVGGTLGVVGAAFQALFRNPLATPDTVGTTAGATLGALGAVALGGSIRGLPLPGVTLMAFIGALTASLVVAAVAASGRARMHDVLLAGIAVTLAASALATGLQLTADVPALLAAAQWSLGHLPQVGYAGIATVLPIAALAGLALLSQTRALQAMVIGEELAHAQGIDVKRVRALALGLGSLGVAACVAWCGPIAFVGLIVPHIVRLTAGAAQRVVLPLSLVLGAGFLVLCDALARIFLTDRELPVGVVTAALGAPALVALVVRQRVR